MQGRKTPLDPKRDKPRARPSDQIEAALTDNRTQISDTLQALQERLGLDGLSPAEIGRSLLSGGGIAIKAVRQYPKTALAVGGGLALLLVGRATVSRDDEDGDEDYPDLGGDDWFIAANRLQEEAQVDLARIDEDEAIHVEKTRQGIAARGSSARDFSLERRSLRDGLAADLNAAFRVGLSDLSDSAQTEMADQRARQYSREVERPSNLAGMVEAIIDHPLVAGAAALAIGGVVNALRPKGVGSDTDLAAERDRLTRRARDLVEEERENAAALADVAARELAAQLKG